MGRIDYAIIEALGKALNESVQEYMQAIGTDQENFRLFRMNFIKKFADDIVFLDDLSEKHNFYHRYGYLIIRNMLEQLIEFLYVQKNRRLVDECLGMKIDLDSFNKEHTLVDGERWFGQDRYTDKRVPVVKMAKDIGEYKNETGTMTLYDVYCILSEKCHNCYFDSLLKDFNAVGRNEPNIGLNDEQIVLLDVMVACVLTEY